MIDKCNIEVNRPDIFNFLRVFALLCVLITHSRIVLFNNIPALNSVDAWYWYSYTPAWVAMGMFFILSGYLLGKGFYKNKYDTSCDGVVNFWFSRLIRILPMYLVFLLVYFIFIKPDWIFVNGIKNLIPILTFTYNGQVGGNGLGSLWFVSTIFQLYLLLPIVYKFIIDKFKKHSLILFILFLIIGLSYRLISLNLNFDWYKYAYIPFWANLDFFFIGVLMNSFTYESVDNKIKKVFRVVSIPILIVFTLYLSFLYYSKDYIFLRYYAPTFVILIFSIIFYAFDYKGRVLSSKISVLNVIKNPLRIVDVLGILSFGFYLYHSFFFSIMPKILMNKSIFPDYLSNGRCITYTYIYTFLILFLWTLFLHKYVESPSNSYRVNLNFSVKEKFVTIYNFIKKQIGGGVNSFVYCI